MVNTLHYSRTDPARKRPPVANSRDLTIMKTVKGARHGFGAGALPLHVRGSRSLDAGIMLIRITFKLGLLLTMLGLLSSALAFAHRTLAQELRLQYGDRVEGEIGAASTADVWRFSGGAGDRVTIRVERLDDSFAPALTVRDSKSVALLDVTWAAAGAPVSEATLRLAQGGVHEIEVRAQPGGAGRYALSLILTQAGATAGRQDVALSYGQQVTGSLSEALPQAAWSFRGEPGDVIDLALAPDSGAFQPLATLISPTGSTVASGTAMSAVRLPMGGIYTIDVRATDSTSGTYRLDLRLRSSPVVDTGFVAAPLDLGVPARGRLTVDAPTARFRVSGSAAHALALDLSNPQARVAVGVLTENRALLDSFAAIGQVRAALAPVGQVAIWLEISSADVTPNQPLDFEVQVSPLRMARRDARALTFDRLRRVAPAPDPDPWFFDARAGDHIVLSLRPEVLSPDGFAQLYGPQGDLLFQRRIDSGFDQPLLLEQAGVYELLIRTIGSEPYTLGLTRVGAGGVPFDLIVDRTLRGPLPAAPGSEAAGEPGARQGEVWTLDIAEAGAWTFELAVPPDSAPLGLRIETPDGAALAERLTLPVSGRVSADLRLAAPGRYRIVVLNPATEGSTPYTLRAVPAGGGTLLPGSPAHGVLFDAQPEHRWAFDLAAPAVVQVGLSTTAGDSSPELALIAPDGSLAPLLPLSPASAVQQGTYFASIAESGEYELVVRIAGPAAHTTYQLMVRASVTHDSGAPVIAPPAARDDLIAAPRPLLEPLTVTPQEQILPATRPGLDVLASAQPAAISSIIRGAIPPDAQYQVWRIQAQSGQLVGLTAVGLGDQSAPDLTLLDEEGAILARRFTPEQALNTLLHRFAAPGRAYVVARGDPGARYLLRVEDRAALDRSVHGVLPGQVIVPGETLRGELLQSGVPAHVYFYAHAGDAIRAQATRPAGTVALSLETAGGGALVTGLTDQINSASATLDFRIPNDSLYRLVVQPGEELFAPGEFTLHLALRSGTASVRDGGRLEGEVFGTLGAGNSADTWLFAAAAGERVTISAAPADDGALPLSVELADTAGTPFAVREALIGAQTLALEAISLPRTGVYRLIVRAARGESGPYRLHLERDLSSLSDAQHVLPLNRTVSRVLTASNTLDVWTFAATEGDVISAEVRVTHGDPSPLSFQIRTQNGGVVATASGDASGRAVAPQVLLPVTGHYTIAVGNLDTAYTGALTYELTVLLESTQARSMGAVLGPDQSGAGALTSADIRDVWLFEGRQGDLAQMVVLAREGGLSASLLLTDWHTASAAGRPDTLASAERSDAGLLALDPVVLPADGVYAIDLSAPPTMPAAYTVHLALEPASALPAAPLPPGGSVEGRLSPTILRQAWTFEGRQGDVAALRVVRDSRGTLSPMLTLYAPAGETLASAQAEPEGEAQIQPYILPENGRYTVAVTRRLGPLGGTEGRYRADLTLEPAPAPATRLLRYGQVGRSWINASAPVEEWVFEGEAGDVIEAEMSVLNGTLNPALRLFGPDGARLADADWTAGEGLRLRARLETTGTFRLEAARAAGVYGLTQGNYALSLDRTYRAAPLSAERMVGYGQRVSGTVDDQTPIEVWAFVGGAGDEIRAAVRFLADDAPLVLALLDPAGTPLASSVRAGGQAIIEGETLPFSGVYLLEVRQTSDARRAFSPYELGLVLEGSAPGAEAQGGVLEPGAPVLAQFSAPAQAHAWLLRAEAGQRAVVSLARLQGSLAVQVTLLAPDGTLLLESEPAPGATALTIGPLVPAQDGLYAIVITAQGEALGLRYRLQLQPLDVSPASLGE